MDDGISSVRKIQKNRKNVLQNVMNHMVIEDTLESIGRCPNAIIKAVCRGGQETWCLPWMPDLYHSQYPSYVCNGRAWSACGPTSIHARPPIVPALAVAHSENWRNRSPTRAPTTPVFTTNVRKNVKKAQEVAQTSYHTISPVVFF